MKKKKTNSLKTFLKKILVCFIIVYICVLLIGQQFDIARLNHELDAVNAQVDAAKRVHKELESELEASKTYEYAERVAREKLGYMKPHEKVFIDSSK